MKPFTHLSVALTSIFVALLASGETPAPTNPPPPGVTLQDFKLVGDLKEDRASFTLTATAKVTKRDGGSLELLCGKVALTGMNTHSQWRLRAEENRFVVAFDHRGEFPLEIKFDAAVRQSDGWSAVDFRVTPSTPQPITLHGLAEDTQFQFVGAARPERKGTDFVSYLPSDGAVKLSWKEARTEAEGKLFYAAEMLSQISVSPGLMRQIALLDGKIMQGEMTRLTLLLRGVGEVTRVQGDQVLAWTVESGNTERFPSERRLNIQFNQPQKNAFALQVQMQTPLGAFPQSADALQLEPDGATRFAGFYRIVNDGAVRLEVAQASGLSQISPEQFPETDATKATFRAGGGQRFVYRFSGADYALRIQADQVQPEVSVSQVIAYNLGENEQAIDSEFELDIREAPLRELLLRVPKGYAIARLNASGLSDYFVSEPLTRPSDTLSPSDGERTGVRGDSDQNELRLVYGQPVSGRQVVQLRLERNAALGQSSWTLPRLEVSKAKSVRGNIAVSADAGFRLTPERTQALTEMATAFFPRKVAGIQSAFRLSDANWDATLRVERLPQTVQADALHLFSIGEGIAYGSSLINYVVSGAPMSAFSVELSDEYFNVEFTGKDIRSWQKTTNGFSVQLNTPVSGAYTLLATYERPFKSQGETLAFTGARPVDAQSEQGHTLVISAYQFDVKRTEVSSNLLPLETGEVPPEYRLFFDAPILAAFRYTSRPFELKLALSQLEQGRSLDQIVDRASLVTRISKEGQLLTDASYLVKSRGNPNFRLTLPAGTELWSATVNGASVVPVKDKDANLIPLPQRADPNAVLKLDLKLAAKSASPARVAVAAPVLNAPMMLAEWKLEPDAGQRLIYRSGSLTPIGGFPDVSGFAGITRLFTGRNQSSALLALLAGLGLLAATVIVWRWTCQEGVTRFSARYFCGVILGLVALAMSVVACINLADLAQRENRYLPHDVTFLAPVQQANSTLTVEVANVEDRVSAMDSASRAWPVLLALGVWVFGWISVEQRTKTLSGILGWVLVAWTALHWQNGAPWFIAVIGAFLLLHVIVPTLRRLWLLPRSGKSLAGHGAPAVAALVVFAAVHVCSAELNSAVSQVSNLRPPESTTLAGSSTPSRVQLGDTADCKSALRPFADSVTQLIRIEDKFALATAKVRWKAEKGQTLPLLFEPAVLTHISYPEKNLKLIQSQVGERRVQQLTAEKNGTFEIELQYQLPVAKKENESGITLPTQYGLVNELELTLVNLDVDVLSPQAVSVQRDTTGSNTIAKLVLAPSDAWVGWKPRSRDVKGEKSVFYAEWHQLYVPSAGVIEGVHYAAIRPAQGEVSELVFDVPKGATVTDVLDGAAASSPKPEVRSQNLLISLWRFDPDTRRLRVSLRQPQSRPFALTIHSQFATGPLPFEQSVGLVSVENAANQIGLLGVATGNEVQLDTVNAEVLSPINLEDFPGTTPQTLAAQIPGLTVRRAFRYADTKATASVKASPVEPDVRIETQDTLSLGEDRIVLAANPTADITRAGIFRLSFALPEGMDVEAISGSALSHWTESKGDAGRVITLHLRGKTIGQQTFAISLAGPGMKTTNGWAVPQLILREASKQRGTLLVVPEQGMRLQVATRDGVTQLDPQKSGIRQKGVLAFRLLQTPWKLTLDLEQVDPWIQVTSLQHATVNEAQVKVSANLQYQIENTGLKAFRVGLPKNAEGVRFQGEQVSDFLPVVGAVTNDMQAWEVKLHRRVIGQYLLQTTYQTLMPDQAAETTLRGVQAADVNLQRGFVTIQTGGRLQVRVDSAPVALQPTEWQSIPRTLQQDLPAASANFAYRLVEPAFELPLKLDRHEAARLLPARVNNITLTSVISDDGVMLTQVRLEMLPGDKRLLHLTLPKDAKFWFAFVNQNGVWPWREQDQILIPLEPGTGAGVQLAADKQTGSALHYKPVPVEVFYSSQIGKAGSSALDLQLAAPKFDLPLENIAWRVFLNEKWQLANWTGALQLQQEQVVPRAAAVDLQTYLASEAYEQRAKTKEAEEMLAAGNTLLERGDPQQARRAFQAAYGLSAGDDAFNEDARVQLNNLKLQQALVGLNVRQATATGDNAAPAGKLRDARGRKEIGYTQQDAKTIIDANSAEENAVFMRLAQRLVQQQDAAVSSPTAIRAAIPEQGRLFTFKRAVVVDQWADLGLRLEATAVRTASLGVRVLILAGTVLVLAVFVWLGRGLSRGKSIARG